MKQTIGLLLSLGCIAVASAQIKTQTILPRKETQSTIEPTHYDSLANIRITSDVSYYKCLIGQRLTFYPRDIHADLRPVGYFNFLSEQPAVVRIDTTWLRKPRKKIRPEDFRLDTVYSNVYRPHFFGHFGSDDMTPLGCSLHEASGIGTLDYSGLTRSGWFTPAEAIDGQSFEVLGVEKCKPSDSELLMFRLRDAEGRILCWFAHAGKETKSLREEYYPVFIEGLLEKYRRQYVDKEFFFTQRKPEAPGYVSDYYGLLVNTMQGEESRLKSGAELHCIDIRMIGNGKGYAVPSFVFEKKEDSTQIYIPLTRYPAPFGIEGYTLGRDHAFVDELVFTPAEEVYAQRAEEARKREEARLQQEKEHKERKAALYRKYGRATAELILDGKVRIGMTRTMCREAWGSPEDINTTSGSWGVHEQWVYGLSSYLYFENGILSSIQN